MAPRCVNKSLPLVGSQPDWLLAQHVLAGFNRFDRPGDVQVIGKRDVNRMSRNLIGYSRRAVTLRTPSLERDLCLQQRVEDLPIERSSRSFPFNNSMSPFSKELPGSINSVFGI
jgi:hypothetical protein